MKLLRLEIENFGKLNGYSLELTDGLNVIHERNGWGKSTLAVFIKAMLYGMPATAKRNLDQNERKKYAPWQGGNYGGSLEFESEKGRFRVERFFGTKQSEDEFRLFDLSTNKPSNAYSEDLGVELFGIDADGFERSAYLSQNTPDIQGENVSVTTKLTGLLEDVNDLGSFDVAIEALEKRRKYYFLKGDKGHIADLATELSQKRAELDTARAQLPEQTEKEKQLADLTDRIRMTEERRETLNEQISQADIRRAHEEERQRMEQQLRNMEKERDDVLDSFRDRQIPTEEEISAARTAMKNFREVQTALQSEMLTEEEAQLLQSLRSRYPNGLPSQDLLTDIQNASSDLTQTRAKLSALGEIQPSRESAQFAKCGIPNQPVLDAAEEKLIRAGELQRQIEKISGASTTPSGTVPLWLAVVFAVAGIACAAIGILVASLQIPLLVAGGILAAAGILLLLLNRRAFSAAHDSAEKEKAALIRQRDDAFGFVRGILERYGMGDRIRENGDLPRLLQELTSLAARAGKDEDARKRREDQIAGLQRQVGEDIRMLNEKFASIGYSSVPKDIPSELVQIRSDIREWNRLIRKQKSANEHRAAVAGQQEEQQTLLNQFVNRLTVLESRKPEECIHRIEQLARDHIRLTGEIAKQKNALADLIRNYGLDRPAPESGTSREDTIACAHQLDELREKQTELTRQLDRIANQTKEIPSLEDAVKHLTVELKTAKENYATLKYTMQFLNDSKDALSTRYLAGMQENFTHYRSLLDGPELPSAVIDTTFDITVRDGGKSRELESYSRGSRDILQICARLALTRAMFSEGESSFLLLDDPFVNLDEDHLRAARDLLERLANEFQILYLVCHCDRA